MRLVQIGSSKQLQRLYYADELSPSAYNANEHFIIDKVLGRRVHNGKLQYLCQFKGYKGILI